MYQEHLDPQKQSLAKEVPELLPPLQAVEGTGQTYAMAQDSHLFALTDSTESFHEQFQNKRRTLLTTSDGVAEQEGHPSTEET